jgi:hypothetical protein
VVFSNNESVESNGLLFGIFLSCLLEVVLVILCCCFFVMHDKVELTFHMSIDFHLFQTTSQRRPSGVRDFPYSVISFD